MRRFGRSVCIFASVLLGASSLSAAELKFDFRDPKGVNSVSFLLDSEVEPIRGIATGIHGELAFDPAAPEKTTGLIVVDTSSLRTPHPEMDKVLLGADWLDAPTNPEISFEIKKIESAKKEGDNRFVLKAAGEFRCKGVAKEMTIMIDASYLKDAAGKRMRGAKGDLLVARANFKINRGDFEIKKGFPGTVVAEEIQIAVQIVGLCVSN